MVTTQFQTGRTYYTSSICDHNCIIAVKIVARTAKTVKAIVSGKDVQTFRPGVNDRGAECFLPWGRGSMMPIIDASDVEVLRPDWERAR